MTTPRWPRRCHGARYTCNRPCATLWGVATRRPDDNVARRLSAIASDMASRNDNYDPALAEDGELGRRIRLTVIICVGAVVVGLAIAGILMLVD